MEDVAQECLGEDVPPGLIYPPPARDKEDFEITRDELEQLKQALKKEQFRTMLNEYAEEVQDPKNRTIFQSELRQLEKQNGNVVHFINPNAGYVLKTSVNGDKKAFINMSSNSMIRKLSFQKTTQGDVNGTLCSIPFAQSPVREDVDKGGRFCDVYDVVFHPNTLALCKVDERIRTQVESTALDAIEKSFNLNLDRNNVRRPKLKYKGLKHATMIKYKIGDNPPQVLDPDQVKNEPPPQPQEAYFSTPKERQSTPEKDKYLKKKQQQNNDSAHLSKGNKNSSNIENEKPKDSNNKSVNWTEPKYSLKYRSHVDMQDFCKDNQREGRSRKPIPEEIVLTIDLPLLKDSSTLEADVLEGGWDFELKAERRASYRLNLKLPFQVHCDQAKASFDVDKRKLVVVMRTVQKRQTDLVFGPTPDSEEEEQQQSFVSSSGKSSGSKPLQALETNNNRHSVQDVVDHAAHEDTSLESESELSSESLSPPPPLLPQGEEEVVTTVEFNPLGESKSNNSEGLTPQSESIPQWINGDVVVKSILKRSARSRSMSESWLDDRSPSEEDFVSLESLNEDEEVVLGSSPSKEKSVRFSEAIQRQLYRSNSSIMGQRKKNQRKSRNKRKARGRLSSEGSVSSMDEEDFSGLSSKRDNSNHKEGQEGAGDTGDCFHDHDHEDEDDQEEEKKNE